MKMKRLLALVTAILLLVSMAACSSAPSGPDSAPADSSGTGSSQTTPSNETIETSFWTDFLVDEAVFTGAINEFTKAYPNYKINFEKFPGSDRAQKLALAKQSNTLPSLLFVASFTCMDEVHQGAMLPVTEQVAKLGDDVLQSSLTPSTINGKNYMYPLFQSYFGMLYNADMFKEAGLEKFVGDDPYAIAAWTLDEYENEILPALKTHLAGTEKYPMAFFAGNNQADTHTNSWLRMLGGTVFEGGKAVAGSDADTVAALDKLYDWYKKGYTNSDVVTKLSTECMGDFKNQKVGVCFGQYTNYASIHADFNSGALEKFDFRIATIPKKDNGTDTSTIASYIYGAMLMNVDEKQQKVAKDFLDWLSENKEGALATFNLCGVPVMKSVLESGSKENPIYAQYAKVDQFVYDFTGAVPGYVETRAFLFPAIQSRFSGERSSEEALKDFDTKSNKIIDEYTKRSTVLN